MKVPIAANTLKDYEDLRSYVLESIYDFSRPLGLDLFLKKGFLFWIKTEKESKVYHEPVYEPERITKNSEFLPDDLQQEITIILANMILERTKNVSA